LRSDLPHKKSFKGKKKEHRGRRQSGHKSTVGALETPSPTTGEKKIDGLNKNNHRKSVPSPSSRPKEKNSRMREREHQEIWKEIASACRRSNKTLVESNLGESYRQRTRTMRLETSVIKDCAFEHRGNWQVPKVGGKNEGFGLTEL